MKILITGGTGQVGSYLADALEPSARVHAPTRAELDLLSAESIREGVRLLAPNWILHAAAYTAVDRAETDRETCFAVNVEATRTLAEEARRLGAVLVAFSTDYVFDGSADRPYREDDATCPLNVYGESKLRAEEALAASGCEFLNFRTSWVYSARGANFVKTMLRLAAGRPELKVVADQQGCPTSAHEIAKAVTLLVQRPRAELSGKFGTYHLAGTGATTWHGFASHLIARARQQQSHIRWTEPEPIPSSAFPTPARRPGNSRLNWDRVRQTFDLELPHWTESVDAVVDDLLRQG